MTAAAAPLSQPAGGTGPAVLLRVLCFAALGALTARQAGSGPVALAAGALAGVLFQWVALTLMAALLWSLNPSVRRQHGYRAVRAAIARGFLLLFPFAVLALAAELALGWNAVQAFTAAGIMGSGAAAGAEVGKLGGGRLRSMLAPTAWSFVLTTTWMIGGSIAPGLLRFPQ